MLCRRWGLPIYTVYVYAWGVFDFPGLIYTCHGHRCHNGEKSHQWHYPETTHKLWASQPTPCVPITELFGVISSKGFEALIMLSLLWPLWYQCYIFRHCSNVIFLRRPVTSAWFLSRVVVVGAMLWCNNELYNHLSDWHWQKYQHRLSVYFLFDFLLFVWC